MHNIHEQAKLIGHKLHLYSSNDNGLQRSGFDDQPELWRKQDLIASILFYSKEQRYFAPNRTTLNRLKEQFLTDTGMDVNVDSLFKKYWLREVIGTIHIPSAIRMSVYSVKKIRECKNELFFLRSLKIGRDGSIDKVEFDNALENYSQAESVKLNLERATEAHLISSTDGKIKVNNLGYYAPVMDHWNEFMFLVFFYDSIHGDNSNLIISKEKLQKVHSEHQKKYALTPPLSNMLASGLATETTEGYIISLFAKQYFTYKVLDEAGAILWKLLNDGNTNIPEEQLVKTWCRKMIVKGEHCDLYKYLEESEIKRFNRGAINIIVNEPDLEEASNEYAKSILDFYMDGDLNRVRFAEQLSAFKFSEGSIDAFDTMGNISKAQRWSGDDYLYFSNSCRRIVAYLIRQILKSYNYDSYNLNDMDDLLHNIHLKPYLTWNVLFWIAHSKPGLIPRLLPKPNMTSALFLSIKKIEVSANFFDSPAELKHKFSVMLFSYILNMFGAIADIEKTQQAKIIFDCLMVTERAVYKIQGQNVQSQRESQVSAKELADNIKRKFQSHSTQSSAVLAQKFYSALLLPIFKFITQLRPEDKFKNGTLDFDYAKLNLLHYVWVLWSELPLAEQEPELTSYEIAKALLECYSQTITAVSTMSEDYETLLPKPAVPIFLPASQNINVIVWSTIYNILEDENMASGFLSPINLTFKKDGGEYDDYNRFVMRKLRAHLRVLACAYKQLKNKENEFNLKGRPIDSSLLSLKTAIMDIVIPFSFNEIGKNRYDIFNTLDERATYGNQQDELIPIIGEIASYFPAADREKLISALLRTDTITRASKLFSVMPSEHDHSLIAKKIIEIDIAAEIDQLNTFTDYQSLAPALAVHPEFQDVAAAVLKTFEEKITTRREDFLTKDAKVTIYRTKLLLAYQANDLEEIDNLPEPESQTYLNDGTRFYPRNDKDFYKALYHYKNDLPEKAYELFNILIHRKDDDTSTLALNRFAARIKWAGTLDDKASRNIMYSEALNEWESYQANLPKDFPIEHIKENLDYNKLICFNGLEQDEEFDSLYSGLTEIERLKSGIFKIIISNRIRRKMTTEAMAMVKSAEMFHKMKNGTVPEFVTEAHDLIVQTNDSDGKKDLFNSLLNSSPDNLVKQIPDSINDGADPSSYILNCIVQTATLMLSKVNAIADINQEDKYSDLMEVGLKSNLGFIKWSVSPARGGFSGSKEKENTGEIDLAFHGPNNQELAICEALILRGENNYEVGTHAVKIFNYTPSKKGLFLLVYYKGPETNYIKSWDKYRNSIINNVAFPESFQVDPASFIDISDKFNNAAVKVATTSHGSNCKLHHVFVNISYRAI